jgi:hypothetical protein
MGRDGRIFLVNPPYERIAPGYAFVKHLANRSPSLGLLHLAAQVRERGTVGVWGSAQIARKVKQALPDT